MERFDFVIPGTPRSRQRRRRNSGEDWKESVRAAARPLWPTNRTPYGAELQVLIIYYYRNETTIDVDNIGKLILDAIKGFLIDDDRLISQLTLRKTDLSQITIIRDPSAILAPFLGFDGNKGNGGVIIEVKSSNRAATRSSTVDFLAREVPKHKGWSFDLVLADKEGIEPPQSLQPSKREIIKSLDEVEALFKEDNRQVALLYAWALLEAATRSVVLRERDEKRFLPQTVVEAVASNGFVNNEEERTLIEIGKLRTWLVHGFTRVTVNRAHVNILVNIIRRILGQKQEVLKRGRKSSQ